MHGDGFLEWTTANPPFLSLMAKRGGGSLFTSAAMLCCVGVLLAWVYLSMEYPDTFPLLYAVPAIAGLLAIIVVLFVVVAAAMRVIGFGYSYRLDADGLTFRYYLGRSSPPPIRIPSPSDRGAESACLGGFGGWVLWSRLHEQGMSVEALDELGAIVLRMEDQAGRTKKDAPTVFLFCGGKERFAAVEKFVNDRLR